MRSVAALLSIAAVAGLGCSRDEQTDGEVIARYVELLGDGEHLAALNTVLDADQEREARALLGEIVTGLEAGTLAPTAGALEPLADTLR